MKNVKEIIVGEKDKLILGVKVVDDYILVFELEIVVFYFVMMMGYIMVKLIYKVIVEKFGD